ncbi:hypothetical protein GGS24DRAFT_275449 [Hypoxylon argillaceum]|nr:hypothetical protein GGS24DRAFT_275449 [Hypoxylon argillaceum]
MTPAEARRQLNKGRRTRPYLAVYFLRQLLQHIIRPTILCLIIYPKGDENKHEHFVTDIRNIDKRKRDICEADLLDLLKGAVTLIRVLRFSYVSIDSICIIQGDGGDFESEAERVELVHGGPHCVIAATHTTATLDKFWVSRSGEPCLEIKIPHGHSTNAPIVESLEKTYPKRISIRGWALQERVLSWRMIIFIEKRAYLACSNGSRCNRGSCKTSI